MEQVLHARGFTTAEREEVRSFLLARAEGAVAATLAATSRRAFDACVEAEMAELRGTLSGDAYQEAGIQVRQWRERLGLVSVPPGQSIQSTRALSVGQPMELLPVDGEQSAGMAVRVTAVDEACFHVEPVESGAVLPALAPGESVGFSLWREGDARYGVEVQFARGRADQAVLSFFHAAAVERLQVRAFMRVRLERSTPVTLVLAAEPPGEAATLAGKIISLSAGGVAVVVDQPLPAAARCRMQFSVPGELPFDFEADVVRMEPNPGGGTLLRAAFVGMPQHCRDALVRYALQAKMRQQAADRPVVA